MESQLEAGARLTPVEPDENLEPVYRLAETTTVGRHPSNGIVISSDSVSRFHARIDRRGNFYILQDLKSSNGTFVNGERITQITLHHGDEVLFGAVEFRFRNPESSASTMDSLEAAGMSIVEFRDDEKPATRSVLSREEFGKLREKSSAIFHPPMPTGEEVSDSQQLLKVNNRLTALYQLSEAMRHAEEDRAETTLERALEILFEALSADRGLIMTCSTPGAGDLEVKALRYRDQPIQATKVTVSRTILEEVLSKRVAILTSDAAADDRFGASESIIMNRIQSAICVPLLQRESVLGVIHLDSQSTTASFTQEDLEFVTLVANELSLSLENARMRREAVHRARLAAVGETVAGISHNIKNILLLIQGGSELLDRALDAGNAQTAKDSWGVVNRGIDKISTLVREMLDYSSNRKPRLKVVDVNDIICEIAEEMEEELIKKSITLELDLDDAIEARLTDAAGLTRTLANLLVNSIEALPAAGGRIVCSTHLRPDTERSIVVKISDTGEGIPKEKLENIFLPFFTTKGSTGTGLGLPMCKKVVEDIGGTIEVESELNAGTTFTITLPELPEDFVHGTENDTIDETV